MPTGGRVCPSCGARLAAASQAGGAPRIRIPRTVTGPPSAGVGHLASLEGRSVPPELLAEDRYVLSRVTWGAVFGVASAIISFFFLSIGPITSTYAFTITVSSSTFTPDLTVIALYVGVICTGLILTLLELWFWRAAFRVLERQSPGFSTPAKMSLLAAIALVVVVLLVVVLFGIMYATLACAVSGIGVTPHCFDNTVVFTLLVLIALGLVALLAGFVGVLVGIMRLGDRYCEGMFKVGAILLILPFLNLAGMVLILTAARKAYARVRGASGSGLFAKG